MAADGVLYLVRRFLVIAPGAVLGSLSGIVFLAALALFFTAEFWLGVSWLVLATVIPNFVASGNMPQIVVEYGTGHLHRVPAG